MSSCREENYKKLVEEIGLSRFLLLKYNCCLITYKDTAKNQNFVRLVVLCSRL